MRPIAKGSEPVSLTAWKKRRTHEELTKWAISDREENASLKFAIRDALLKEQGFVCCYCEQRIEHENSHIEHLASRDAFPRRTFDYSNLLACCQESKQCGNLKGSNALKVHPLMPDCRDYFRFISDGRVLPVDDPTRGAAAQETIDNILGLNTSLLRAKRKAAIQGFTQVLNQVTDPELARTIVEQIDARNEQGQNSKFASALLYVFRPRSAPGSTPAPSRK